MKRQIRHGVFETNSSSTHSITMMMKSDYIRLVEENLFIYKGSGFGFTEENQPVCGRLYTKEECIDFVKTNDWYTDEDVDWDDEDSYVEYLRDEFEFYNSDYESENLEYYYKEFETPSGEVVVAFGEYGYGY